MHDASTADRVRFGPFELDVRSRELFKGPTRLKVPDQSIEILKALIERPGQLVTREDLRQRLWADNTFVDFEHGLNAAVRRLREALGDSAETPRFIETLPRRGYRFAGRVDRITSLPSVLDQRQTDSAVLPESRPALSKSWRRGGGWPIGALLVLLAVVPLVVWKERALTKSPIRSLAVLPFKLVGDPKQDYLSEWLTEALGAALAQVHTLDVRSAASATVQKHEQIGR